MDNQEQPQQTPDSNYLKLATVNVNAKVEKKNNLSYLSWAWAVDQLLRIDPSANWHYPEEKRYGDTVMVFCTVTAFGKAMTAQLPVMNHKNQPIPNPDAFQVNTAMQRCLAKAIALHGLGLYIYAGEDLPDDKMPEQVDITPTLTAQQIDALKAKVNAAKTVEDLRIAYEMMADHEREVVKALVSALKKKLEAQAAAK